MLAALAYYLTKTGLLTLMISLQTGRPVLKVWRESIWFAPAFILLGLIGAFVGAAFHAMGWIGALLCILPILPQHLYVVAAVKALAEQVGPAAFVNSATTAAPSWSDMASEPRSGKLAGALPFPPLPFHSSKA